MTDIRLFLTDVDGTLTDGGMYYTSTGDTMKKFNTRDGMGLQLLQRAGVKVGIVTSETTEIVTRRAEKLGLDFLVQGKRDGGKLAAALDICSSMGITMSQVAYIGDDVNHAAGETHRRHTRHEPARRRRLRARIYQPTP